MQKKIRILIADDDEIVRIIWKDMNNSNYSVECVEDGLLVTKADLSQIDIIFLDVNMPNISGIEATKIVREKEINHKHKIPIIAVTGHISPAIINECLEAGINDVLNKPLLTEDLENILLKWRVHIEERRQGLVKNYYEENKEGERFNAIATPGKF